MQSTIELEWNETKKINWGDESRKENVTVVGVGSHFMNEI